MGDESRDNTGCHTPLHALGSSVLIRGCLLACVLILPTVATSAELVAVNGSTVEAQLTSVEPLTAVFETEQGQQQVALEAFVRWGAPEPQPPRPRVVLRDGSELVAAPPWTRDGSIQIDDRQLKLQSVTLGRLEMPRASIERLLFEAARDPEVEAALARDRPASEEDDIELVNGDILRGKLGSIRGGKATLNVRGEPIEIELKRIAAVHLNRGSSNARRVPETGVVVGLKDGSLLHAKEVAAEANRVKVTLVGGGAKVTVRALNAIRFLQPFGDHLVYLSDLPALDYRHTPYAGVAWHYARDTNLLDGPLRAGGRRFIKGLAMHSPSRLVYRLTPGEFARLDFTMAIDEAGSTSDRLGGSVVFRVLVARQSGFSPAFTSDIIRAGDVPQAASVDVANARAIALVVEPADFGDRLDHGDWLDIRLTKSEQP